MTTSTPASIHSSIHPAASSSGLLPAKPGYETVAATRFDEGALWISSDVTVDPGRILAKVQLSNLLDYNGSQVAFVVRTPITCTLFRSSRRRASAVRVAAAANSDATQPQEEDLGEGLPFLRRR